MGYLNEDVLEYTLRKLKTDVLDDKMNVADIEDSVSATSSYPVKSSGIYAYVNDSVENKVDKVTGKGLSTNDFTTTYKNQLDGMNDFDGSYDSLTGKPTVDSTVTETSDNAVKSSGIYDYVNSSISTNTAYFRGTFNSVTELNAYAGDKTLNDYAFVRTTDSAGNTLYNRYKWNNTSWVFEYALNNSSFTANQWSTINSGLTSADKITVDSTLSSTSTNPVQNKVIKGELDKKLNTSDMKNTYGVEETTVPTLKDLSNPVANSLDCWGINVNGLKNSFTADRKYHRVIASVDMGTLDWKYDSTNTQSFYRGNDFDVKSNTLNMKSTNGYVATNKGSASAWVDGNIFANQSYVYIKDSTYNGDVSAFKNAMQGVILYYELATPVDEEVSFYTKASVDERLNEVSIVETVSKSCNGTSAGEKYIILYRMPKNNTSGHHSVSFILSDWDNTGKSSTGIWICQISNINKSAHFNVKNLIPAENCEFGWYADNDYFYYAVKQPSWNGYSIITLLTPKNQISTSVEELMTKRTTQPDGWTKVTEL